MNIVLDTNIVLDIWLFEDPSCTNLRSKLEQGQLHWLATQGMQAELRRVLTYPHLLRWMAGHGVRAENVWRRAEKYMQFVDIAPSCAVRCSDLDDQMFIDLAVAHQATLLSKDHAVLQLSSRLRPVLVINPTAPA